MIIKQIIIKNFRSYYGENKFDFSDGLTLIIGDNGDGKTTFLMPCSGCSIRQWKTTALIMCLRCASQKWKRVIGMRLWFQCCSNMMVKNLLKSASLLSEKKTQTLRLVS